MTRDARGRFIAPLPARQAETLATYARTGRVQFAATGAAILSAAFLAGTQLPADIGTAILVGVLLAISLPQLLWYAAYRAGRFS